MNASHQKNQTEISQRDRSEKDASFFDESEETPEHESPEDESEETLLRRKVKNLMALVILLTGLFVGSLYVDVAQLFSRQGFSTKELAKTDVVRAADKTWVAYSEPMIRVTALTDESCTDCQTDEAIVWMRRIFPTVSVRKMDVSKNAEAKDMIERANIVSVPAFVFSRQISEVSVFSQAKELFREINGGEEYVLETARVGIPVGKYITMPTIGEKESISGSKDAPVKVVQFTDFQCPMCKGTYTTLMNELKGLEGKVQYVHKSLPLPMYPQSETSSLAAECAHEQGKFTEYADLLFQKQDEWSKGKDSSKFKEYARSLGLNAESFSSCLDGKKYAGKLEDNKKEALKFSIVNVPTIFVNDTILSGVVSSDALKGALEKALSGKKTESPEEKKEK